MASLCIPPNTSFVDIGTHSLALYTHGPEPSSSSFPVVLFVSGVASSSLSWAAVVRLLPPTLRSYTYDRSGYRNSETSPLVPTAENIALELSLLIKEAAILNPVVLVGHSWAGVLISEFIYLTGTSPQIAGLVLVDANHGNMPQVLNVNDPDLQVLATGLEPYAAKGIEAEHKLTREEWEAFRQDEITDTYALSAQQELEQYAPSFETLRIKRQQQELLLGQRPVHVIGGRRSRDWTGLYKAGVSRGNGTEEQRSRVRELIRTADAKADGLSKEWLKLSAKSKFVVARESGHFVQLTQPDLIVEGVQWVVREAGTLA